MKSGVRTGLNVFVGVAVAGVFLFLAFRHVSLTELAHAFGHFDLRWLIPAVAVSLVLQVFRAWRWRLELLPLERIALGRLWIVTSIAYMAINLIPGRLGEFARPWLLSKRSSLSFSNVVGNLLLEKTMDSVVIVFYILIGLLSTENLPAWVRRGALFPAAAAVILVALVVLLWWRGEAFFERWLVRYLPQRWGAGLMRFLGAVIEGMKVLPNARLLGAVFAVSVGLWFLPILSSYILIRAFHFAVPFGAALIVFIFIGFGTALPQGPGMIGTYQYACILALGLFGVSQPEALAYGLVLNGIQLATLVGQGLVALALSGVSVEELARARRQYASAT